jgi:hypothetical protein
MKRIRYLTPLAAVALFALLPVSSFADHKKAKPIVVSINDVPNGDPVIQVQGAPHGYDINTVAPNNPAIEDGALITLFGVDQGGSIPDWEGRFVVPTAPDPLRTAVDIVWIEHDFDLFGNGDLRVGFNSAFPGNYYRTVNSLGLVTDDWVTVYADDTLVVKFKPHTYRLRDQEPVKMVPYKSCLQIHVVEQSTDPATGITEQVLEGQGFSSHMGAVTVWAKIQIDEGAVDPSGTSYVSHFSGIEIETAANGDTVESTIQGVESIPLPVPSPFIGYITGTRTVTGGTGRFLGASGSMTLKGVDSNGVTLEVEGVISKVGSCKK